MQWEKANALKRMLSNKVMLFIKSVWLNELPTVF